MVTERGFAIVPPINEVMERRHTVMKDNISSLDDDSTQTRNSMRSFE